MRQVYAIMDEQQIRSKGRAKCKSEEITCIERLYLVKIRMLVRVGVLAK